MFSVRFAVDIPNYNPSDCQNFASQCVWYGFGGTNSSTNINSKDFPMIGSGTRAWYQTATQYDDSLSWINVISFADYVSSSSTSTRGIFGWINNNNLSYAEVGDTIQIYSSSQGWYHTYVVNAVTGTSGSRTNSNIWVCAHTSNRNNERLDTVIGSSDVPPVAIPLFCRESRWFL
ncbi:hypothetical protein HGA64_05260 [Candidatus Falkowbacteria bacterium]|nr:hypothetical protein [Candidatus Falkowbacteria bacterium]